MTFTNVSSQPRESNRNFSALNVCCASSSHASYLQRRQRRTHRNVEHQTLSSAHAHVESYLTRRSWKERWALLEPMPQLWKNSSNKPGGTTVRDSFTDTTADSRSRELLRLDLPRRRDCDRWLCLRSTPGRRTVRRGVQQQGAVSMTANNGDDALADHGVHHMKRQHEPHSPPHTFLLLQIS